MIYMKIEIFVLLTSSMLTWKVNFKTSTNIDIKVLQDAEPYKIGKMAFIEKRKKNTHTHNKRQTNCHKWLEY